VATSGRRIVVTWERCDTDEEKRLRAWCAPPELPEEHRSVTRHRSHEAQRAWRGLQCQGSGVESAYQAAFARCGRCHRGDEKGREVVTTIRRQLDPTGGYLLPSGVRYTGLAAQHAVNKEMRAAGYKPVGDWQDGSRVFILQSGETEKEVAI